MLLHASKLSRLLLFLLLNPILFSGGFSTVFSFIRKRAVKFMMEPLSSSSSQVTSIGENIDSLIQDFDCMTLPSSSPPSVPFSFSVAPMMAHTNRNFRYFWRCFSKISILYTEMVMADEIVRNRDNEYELDRLLGCDHIIESPLVLQLGGNNPTTLRHAVKIARSFGYKHFNLNCGCPSATVATESVMGASLMLSPELTAACCAAMNEELSSSSSTSSAIPAAFNIGTSSKFIASSSSGSGDACSTDSINSDTTTVYPSSTSIILPPLSVKCRIGVNDQDSYEDLYNFINIVNRQGGVTRFQIHARKAVLGLNTKDNRLVPPLKYEYVYRLVKDFPSLQFEINGGVESLNLVAAHRSASGSPGLVGVMVGRACVNHPYSFIGVDSSHTFNSDSGDENGNDGDKKMSVVPSRGEILEKYAQYCDSITTAAEYINPIDYTQHENQPGISSNSISNTSHSTHQTRRQRSIPVSVLIAPIYNLFAGEEGCDKFRRRLKKLSLKCSDAASVIRAAASEIPTSVLWERRGEYVSIDQLVVHEKMPKVTAPLHSRIV